MLKIKAFLQQYFKIAIPFLITLLLIRGYEYFLIAAKFFVAHTYAFEIVGWLYDVWTWLIYCFILFIVLLLIYLINSSFAKVIFHVTNIIFIILYLALIIVFSERNTPFDHEFFTRSMKESWLTTQQMMTSGFLLYLPFIFYVLFYFGVYLYLQKRINFKPSFLLLMTMFCFVATGFIKYSSPNEDWFKQKSAYYLVCNKFNYWLYNSYQYYNQLRENNKVSLNNVDLEKAITFYQKNQPFNFTNKKYPLLHEDNSKDVLGSFFNFNSTAPNIVLLVVEGLSKDFSGENAYAGSFTPFLDSLSNSSLVWDNFLSTAPGTFAAHPAISGSLPYGNRGFSLMENMPNHLSLIKILKENGYHTQFMIGFDPDFDNMGGYIRLQGTDFILSKYPSKYKKMGIGSEGWSMGYPDDALYSRSFEVLDSLKKYPYLSIYHTGTTHMPYLFEQKLLYKKLFEKKVKTMLVSSNIKSTLNKCKDVLETFMFSDDCIKKFFFNYAKRLDFKNTIFIITGDHHIGSFPSTGVIDDYHVPLIIYSPMLKMAKKFHSINSHNNLTPTITSLLFHHFNLPYQPKEVHWLGDVMDTSVAFRNIHSMPFMEWSREISDYLYKNYLVSGNQLYKLNPNLLEEEYKNDSLKNYIIQLRENFKTINKYVCEHDKIYPPKQNNSQNKKELLLNFTDSISHFIFSKGPDKALIPDFKILPKYKYLYVEFTAEVNLPSPVIEDHTVLRLAIIENKTPRNYLYWSKREITLMSKNIFLPQKWNIVSANDMFTLEAYKKIKNLIFEVAIYTDLGPIKLQLKQMNVKIYGVTATN